MKKITLLLMALLLIVGSAKADVNRTTIYVQNHTYAKTYTSEVSIPAASFSSLSSGDKLFLIGKGNVQLCRKTEWGTITTVTLTTDGVSVDLSDDEISNLKSAGMDIQSTENGVIIQQVSYGNALTYGDPSDVTRNSSGDIEATAISNFKIGDQLIFNFSFNGEEGDSFKFDLDNEGWSALKTANWITYADKTAKTVTYTITEAILSELGSGRMRLRGEHINYTSVKIKQAGTYSNTYIINDANASVNPSMLTRTANIKINRAFDNYWNTLCLPFDCPVTSVFGNKIKVYKFKEYSSSNLVFVETTPDNLSAGVPYLINLNNTAISSISLNNVSFNTTIIPSVNGDFTYTGNYATGFDMEGKYGQAYVAEDGNKFRKGGSGSKLNAFRAYFSTVGTFAAREMSILFDDETTGISTVESEGVKTLSNEYYSLNGQRVANPRKGLYIVNGKKVIIK